MSAQQIDVRKIWSDRRVSGDTYRANMIPALRAFLQGQKNPHAELMTRGWTEHPLDEKSAGRMQDAVLEHRANGKISREEMVNWLRLCYAFCVACDRQGLSVVPTGKCLHISQPSSPFQADLIQLASKVDVWRTALHEWIEHQLEGADRMTCQTAVVLNGILSSALIEPGVVARFIDKLDEGNWLETKTPLEKFECLFPYSGLGNHHLRRPHLDSLTSILIYRIPDQGKSISHQNWFTQVKNLLKSMGVAAQYLPVEKSDLYKGATTWWLSLSHMGLIGHTRRTLISNAIHGPAWRRLLGESAKTEAPSVQSNENQTVDTDHDPADPLTEIFTAPEWLYETQNRLERCPENQLPGEIETLLEQHKDDPIAKTFLKWLIASLAGQSATKKGLSLSTISARFSATLPYLLGSLEVDPAELKTPELEDIYYEIASHLSDDLLRKHVLGGLRDFHSHMVREYRIPPISDEQEVLGESGCLRPVSANLLSFDEYTAAQAWLDQQISVGRTLSEIKTCKIVLMLAFRCGLRRMEIFGLRLMDIHTEGHLVIVLQPNSKRGLKTDNSRRVSPLYALLPQSERQMLRDWVADRLNQMNQSRMGYLFHEFRVANHMNWVNKITDRVCEALRTVTGDPDIYLHHLRHAFATWTYLRLVDTDQKICAHFRHLPHTFTALRSTRKLHVCLVGRIAPTNRDFLFVVSKLMGHSSPAITLEHYIHGCDLILGNVIAAEAKDVPRKIWLAASGLRKTQVYEIIRNHGHAVLVHSAHDHYKLRKQTLQVTTGAGQSDSDLVRTARGGRPPNLPAHLRSDWIKLEKLFRLLEIYVTEKLDIKKLAIEFDLTDPYIESILKLFAYWGPTINLTVEAGKLREAPSLKFSIEDKEFFDRVERGLAALAFKSPEQFDNGIYTHLERVNRQKWDVVFKPGHLSELKRYLKFLNAIGIQQDECEWTLRAPPGVSSEIELPNWVTGLSTKWLPSSPPNRVGPPSIENAESYRDWVGIKVKGRGHLLAKIFYLSLGVKNGLLVKSSR